MNEDELRRALGDYAAAAPSGDPRPGLHARLARRRTMRAVAGIAAAAAFVAGTGVAVVLNGDRPAGVIVAAEPSATATPSGEPSTPPLSPSPSPAVTVSPTASRAAEPVPPPGPSEAPPSPSPSSPPEPVGEPATATAEGEHGLRVRVTLDPANPATARMATLVVEVTDDDGSVESFSVEWGDGAGESFVRTASCAYPRPPANREPSPVDSAMRYEHAWRHAGEFRVRVHIKSAVACEDRVPPEEVRLEVTARVRAGASVSNGPAAPSRPDFTPRATGEAPREVEVDAQAFDGDGYVRSAVVEWGDGTTTTVGDDEVGCADGGGRYYPENGALRVYAAHTYARPGTYEITVRYASTGCDGEDAQRASATESFLVV